MFLKSIAFNRAWFFATLFSAKTLQTVKKLPISYSSFTFWDQKRRKSSFDQEKVFKEDNKTEAERRHRKKTAACGPFGAPWSSGFLISFAKTRRHGDLVRLDLKRQRRQESISTQPIDSIGNLELWPDQVGLVGQFEEGQFLFIISESFLKLFCFVKKMSQL